MNWTRYKLLIISGGICLIVSGGLIFWILSTRGKSEDVNSQIQNLQSAQTRLFSQKPYPSDKNFEQLKAEQAKVVEQRNTLKKLIREGQLKPDSVGRAYFGEHITKWVAHLRNEALTATTGGEKDVGVVLSDPDFGMTEYLQGLPPDNARLPDLMLDLEVIEHLSLLLFESGISELVDVKRVEEETPAGRRGATDYNNPYGNNPMMTPMGGMGQPGMQPVEVDERSKLAREKDRLFDWEDYRVEFRVYEDYLWESLNNLITDPNLFVLKELYVTNSNEILWPKGLEPVLGKNRSDRAARAKPRTPRREMSDLERLLQGGGAEAGTETTEDSEVKRAGLAARNQNIVGGDLLNVVMVVRVYRLTEETQETEEGR